MRGRLDGPETPGRGEAPLPLARGRRRPSTATAGGFELRLDEPAFGVAPGQTAVLYSDDAVVGAGVDHVRDRRLRLAAMLASHVRRRRALPALAFFLLVVGLGLGWALLQLGDDLRAQLSSFIRGTRAELLPVIHKVGGVASTG